jgi:hypothetical protein
MNHICMLYLLLHLTIFIDKILKQNIRFDFQTSDFYKNFFAMRLRYKNLFMVF